MDQPHAHRRSRPDDLEAVRLMQRIAVVANEAEAFCTALRSTLDEVCGYTGWPVGHAYVTDPTETDELASTSIWHLDDPERFTAFRRITEAMPLRRGIGLPGRVFATGVPHWILDVTGDENFPRAHEGIEIGVRGAFATPVLVGTEVIAVLEFFSEDPEPIDERLLELMGYVGTQLGRVAERTKAAAEMRGQLEQMRHLLDSAYEAFVQIDAHGAITGWNRAAEEMFGMTRRDVLGLPLAATIIPHRYREQHLAGVARYLATSRSTILNQRLELCAIRSNGEEFPVELAIWPVTQNGATHFCAFIQDVTERKHAADAVRDAYEREREMVKSLRELDASKTGFVSSVSHELRTPLTSIIGYLQLLVSTGDEISPEHHEMLGVIERNSQRLLSLIEDLLTQSRIESGSFKLSLEPTLVGPIVEAAVESILPSAAQRDLEIDVKVDSSVGGAMADSSQLERLILNLLTNAIKFTQHGRVCIEARRDGSVIVLSVSDTGIGIPTDDLGKLFSPFFRSSNGTSAPGTGLGLVIVKAIVDAHGGTISVDSALGGGTTFEVRLPSIDVAVVA